MGNEIRCLLDSNVYPNKTINHYQTKDNKTITEVKTDLGDGEQGIREIERDITGNITNIKDQVFGRIDTFYPGRVGVIMKDADGVETALPHITMEHLAKTAEDPSR